MRAAASLTTAKTAPDTARQEARVGRGFCLIRFPAMIPGIIQPMTRNAGDDGARELEMRLSASPAAAPARTSRTNRRRPKRTKWGETRR
jgi:hypothetical protein